MDCTDPSTDHVDSEGTNTTVDFGITKKLKHGELLLKFHIQQDNLL